MSSNVQRIHASDSLLRGQRSSESSPRPGGLKVILGRCVVVLAVLAVVVLFSINFWPHEKAKQQVEEPPQPDVSGSSSPAPEADSGDIEPLSEDDKVHSSITHPLKDAEKVAQVEDADELDREAPPSKVTDLSPPSSDASVLSPSSKEDSESAFVRFLLEEDTFFRVPQVDKSTRTRFDDGVPLFVGPSMRVFALLTVGPHARHVLREHIFGSYPIVAGGLYMNVRNVTSCMDVPEHVGLSPMVSSCLEGVPSQLRPADYEDGGPIYAYQRAQALKDQWAPAAEIAIRLQPGRVTSGAEIGKRIREGLFSDFVPTGQSWWTDAQKAEVRDLEAKITAACPVKKFGPSGSDRGEDLGSLWLVFRGGSLQDVLIFFQLPGETALTASVRRAETPVSEVLRWAPRSVSRTLEGAESPGKGVFETLIAYFFGEKSKMPAFRDPESETVESTQVKGKGPRSTVSEHPLRLLFEHVEKVEKRFGLNPNLVQDNPSIEENHVILSPSLAVSDCSGLGGEGGEGDAQGCLPLSESREEREDDGQETA